MEEKSKIIFFDRDTLFPPQQQPQPEHDDENEEETTPSFRLPSPFALGIQITLSFFARCIKVTLIDVDSNDSQTEMENFRQEKKNFSMIFVNACKAPTMGALVAAVPRFENNASANLSGRQDGIVSSSTLLQPSPSSMVMMGGLATSISGASESSSPQELIAKSVGERLIMRERRKNLLKKSQEDKDVEEKLFFSDKMILVSCGVGLGAGMNPKEGGDFLGNSLSNPMLPAGIVNAIFEMCSQK